MHITHEQAQRFIQLDLDHSLSAEQENQLSAHLRACAACLAYAQDLDEVERLLPPAMKRRWDIKPIPLPIGELVIKSHIQSSLGHFLATRKLVVALVCMAFAFGAWQFMIAGPGRPTPWFVAFAGVPTPSADFTSTSSVREDCGPLQYAVQKGDTLESLAIQFGLSEKELIDLNHLQDRALAAHTILSIPACTATPTATDLPGPHTQTYTPPARGTQATPGPGG